MRILVYGAGVLGSYLAHVLIQGKNDVTVLARGQRLGELKEQGLIIRHYLQLKTTKDKVNVIDELRLNDKYDIIFVVMQYTHLPSVLPVLAQNQSQYILFVGNNADPKATQEYLLHNSTTEKQVAFGFQSTGGRRENGKVICVRAGGHMELGGLNGSLSWKPLINKIFMNTRYKLTYFDNMDAWCKCHIALIMPLCHAAYIYNGDMRQVGRDKRLLHQIIAAMDEGYRVLENNGYPLTPANEADLVRRKRRLFYIMLKIISMTPLGRLAISDHAMSAVEEMTTLNDAFDSLKRQAHISTPNWDAIIEKNTKVGKYK